MLETTEESVTSALKRGPRHAGAESPAPRATATAALGRQRELVERFTTAFEANDVEGIVVLLADDVRLSMPPLPLEYRGLAQAGRFLTHVAALHHDRRVVQTRANMQPALARYARDPGANVYRALGLLVVTLAGNRISAITRFDTSVFFQFGLPRTLPR